MEDMELVKILWDYMKLGQKLEKCDAIFCLGCMDCEVAKIATKLYLQGFGNQIIFSGGYGKRSKKVWHEPEAEKFANIAESMGVSSEKIYIENQSTNTSENFKYVKKLIEEKNLPIKSLLIVGRPYVERRSYACLKKIMPEYKGVLASEEVSCEAYFSRYEGVIKKEEISVLVGDVQRMKVYAEKGWQIEVEMPDQVWKAYEELVRRGYGQYIIFEK